MLRRGYRFALVMEDDASYEDGSKLVAQSPVEHGSEDETGASVHHFSTHLGYEGDMRGAQ